MQNKEKLNLCELEKYNKISISKIIVFFLTSKSVK